MHHPDSSRRAAAASQSATPPDPWHFAPLTAQQQRERTATETALREQRVRVFRAFDDTVAGALA